MQAHCNIDILDFFRHKYSIRKLIMWIRHLPSESALAARGIAGDDRWGKGEYLAAIIADYINVLDYHFLSANGAKSLKKPEFIERPDMSLKKMK